MGCRAYLAIDEWHVLLHSWKAACASDEHTADYTRSDKLHLFTWLLQTTFHACCLRERQRYKERECKGSESNHQSNRASAVIIWRAGFSLRRSVRVRLVTSGCSQEGLCFFSNTFKICSSRLNHLTSAKPLLSALSISLCGLVLTRTIIKPDDFKTDIINHWHEMQQIQTSHYHIFHILTDVAQCWIANEVSSVCLSNKKRGKFSKQPLYHFVMLKLMRNYTQLQCSFFGS